MNRPQRNNNPMALIQQIPSKWKGLVGKNPDGFLIFESPLFGLRAGVINLINTYIKRGLDTIEKIFPVYAPKGHGTNDPEVYIKIVSKLTGIPRNKKISNEQELYKIAKAIVTHEEGNFWMTMQDFNSGFESGMNSINRNKLFTGAVTGLGVVTIIILILIYIQ
jgi:hypothetical protein